MKKFSSDFETTTDKVSDTETWVWAWSCCDIDDINYIKYGNNIESFINFCIELKNSTHYFHNLKFDGLFIIDYLYRKLNMRCLNPNEKPQNNTFSVLINKMNVVYSIEVYFYKKGKSWVKIKFLDSLKIIPMSVDKIAKEFKLPINKLTINYDEYRSQNHKLTDIEKAYITNDVKIVAMALKQFFDNGDTKITAGSNALNAFKKTLSNDKKQMQYIYRKLYPVLSNEINEDIRKAYKGGYVYVNPNYQNQILYDMLVFDKNSMYPSHMRNRDMPYGEPIFFEGKYDGVCKFYIQHLFCKFKVKKGMVPTIQLKNNSSFISTEYIRDSRKTKKNENIDEAIELFLSNLDLELFLTHYDVWELEYINGWAFKTNRGVFNQFIDANYTIKCTSTGGIRMLSKLKLNSLYGKYATNIDVTGKITVFEKDKKLNEKIVKFKTPIDENGNKLQLFREPEYTPLGVAITAYARYDLITTIDKLGGENENSRFVYCDTDSVHILGYENPTFIPQDDAKLDYWKQESKVNKAIFLRAKTYLEEINLGNGKTKLNVKCAGMPKNIKDTVSFNNFKIGFKSGAKLKPKIVKGGVLLVNSPFEIKE